MTNKAHGPGPDTALVELQERLAAEADPGRRRALIDEALRPPEPQLLDTCVLQNLDWVDRQLEANGPMVWDDVATAELVRQYGTDLAHDLIDVGILYKRFEWYGGYPWLVCDAALEETGLLQGPKGRSVRDLLEFLVGHQEQWSNDAYPGIAQGLLLAKGRARVSPLILRGLGVQSVEELHAADGPLSFLADRGDRLVATHALLSNIPVVLTTDRKTFWARRDRLLDMGLQVMRPSELLDVYEPYWKTLEAEFARRRAENPRRDRR
ncbi:hypothetical protein [Sandaracinus amylolyticus]|uniref:hypothetical protein n=1 Tax=Sandaracinus amylolyticus TaxID=927083 RepID=UPI001F15F729|nr:hypothetical protein [Sandaracinus amylolyticus]UJR83203.1 Hypothetical protein I5071_52690 [Sandaracinus amylolyticus]